MQLPGKKLLITGADGFIGSHLTEYLVRLGCVVRAFVQYNSFGSWGWLDRCAPEAKECFEVFAGDIRDPNCVARAMAGCDVIFHLAALIAIPYSYVAPMSYVETNVLGTLNVVQSATDLKIAKVIHVSTSEVYGSARFVPITEEHPLSGQSPYAASKIAADQIAMSFYYSFGTPVSVARPFNTYGPRQSIRAIIPTVIAQICSNKGTVKVGATHPTRDFSYITDTVSGLVAVGQSERSIGEVINIGSNYEISIADTIALIGEIMKVRVELETEESRLRPQKSEVERLWADNTKAKRLLEWRPKYGGTEGLKRGLEETIDWFKIPENFDACRSKHFSL